MWPKPVLKLRWTFVWIYIAYTVGEYIYITHNNQKWHIHNNFMENTYLFLLTLTIIYGQLYLSFAFTRWRTVAYHVIHYLSLLCLWFFIISCLDHTFHNHLSLSFIMIAIIVCHYLSLSFISFIIPCIHAVIYIQAHIMLLIINHLFTIHSYVDGV